MFDFFKKRGGSIPPDVGKEKAYDDANGEKPFSEVDDSLPKEAEDVKEKVADKKSKKKMAFKPLPNMGSMEGQIKLEKLETRIDALDALMKGYSERFSSVNQQLGEIKAMNLDTEKSLAKLDADSAMAIDAVKEVKPENLRVDYQKLGLKVDTLSEKLEANKQFSEGVMDEIKELKQKAEVFIGTDALLKLNEDVKKDLIEVQKLGSRVRANADKTEQIFIEVRKGFAESQKASEMVSNLDESYSGLSERIEKLELDHSDVVSHKEFVSYKKNLSSKFDTLKDLFDEIEKLRSDNQKLTQLIEMTLLISKKNKEDLSDMAMVIGDDHVDKVGEYDEKLNSVLKIVDTLAGQISQVRKGLGMASSGKVVVEDSKNVSGRKKLKMKNIDVHPEVSKPLLSTPKKVSAVKKSAKSIKKKSVSEKKVLDEVSGINDKIEEGPLDKLLAQLRNEGAALSEEASEKVNKK